MLLRQVKVTSTVRTGFFFSETFCLTMSLKNTIFTMYSKRFNISAYRRPTKFLEIEQWSMNTGWNKKRLSQSEKCHYLKLVFILYIGKGHFSLNEFYPHLNNCRNSIHLYQQLSDLEITPARSISGSIPVYKLTLKKGGRLDEKLQSTGWRWAS